MSYTPDDQKFGDNPAKAKKLIEELQGTISEIQRVIKARRLQGTGPEGWKAEHLNEIGVLNQTLTNYSNVMEGIFWEMDELEKKHR